MTPEHDDPYAPDTTGTWGGRRPGAGAPRGNLNALRNGRHSRRISGYLHGLVREPVFQRVILELMRVEAAGGDLRPLLLEACRGMNSVHFDLKRQRTVPAKIRQKRARFAREIERSIRGVPAHVFPEPPPTLPLGDDGHPVVFTDEITGAPFNPLKNRHEPVDPDRPATILRATRDVQRQLRRQYHKDLAAWAVRTSGYQRPKTPPVIPPEILAKYGPRRRRKPKP